MEVIYQLADVFQYEWAQRALLASSLVGIMCGILGCFIMLRNMALIGDALSHAILPGVVVGFIIAGHSVLAFFTGAVVSGLITAILITWIQRNVKSKEDAAIGIVFTTMFALGVMGISYVSRQQGVHLDMKDFLFGNVLGIANQDLWLTSLITGYVIVCVVLFYRYFLITTFQQLLARTMGISASTMHYFLMLLLSFAVVASLQSVGVILVIAMLIIPASTAYLLTNKLSYMILVSALIGLLSSILGLMIAIVLETTPGPAMSVTAALFYGITVLFAPERGLFVNYVRKQRKLRRIQREDILKAMIWLKNNGEVTRPALAQRTKLSSNTLNKQLKKLTQNGWVTMHRKEPALTEQGISIAYRLIRAHRLWETYMVESLGYEKEQIHQQAEKFEHLLPEKFLEQVDKDLGFPATDPHGSPIPQLASANNVALIELLPSQRAVIFGRDIEDTNALQLWQMGIAPNIPLLMKRVDDDYVIIEMNAKLFQINKELAQKVKVSLL